MEESTNRVKKHSFVWNELLSTNVAADKKFYTEVFGWETETKDAGGHAYTIFKFNGEHIGGMMQNPNPTAKESIWITYVAVDDVVASLNKAVTAGAKIIVNQTAIENVGSFALATTKTGSFIGFFKPLPM